MGRRPAAKSRVKGHVEELPSGALRVSVYAGMDPVTGKRHYLREIIDPGPRAKRDAENMRIKLLNDVRERRNPRTNATVDELLTRYMDQFDGAPNTRSLYEGYIRRHISPLLGHVKIGLVDADILDSFYAELRRCRTHCSGRRVSEHRTSVAHECDDRCGPHQCRPLSATTVRHMHFVLSGAYRKAARWRWVSVSPISQAEPPPAPAPNPQPPTPVDAARIINEAWRDPDWGTLIWLAMTTGARRGELAAIQWADLDLSDGRASLWLRRAIRKDENGRLVAAELKTHQQRRLALDADTVVVLRDHQARWAGRVTALGRALKPRSYVFSGAPDGSTWPVPANITRRYERLAARLDIETTFHKLRHYTATELIAAGVDVRTVAGRLGHSGGGTTTLRAYTAWVSEADQRAATGLGSGMPTRPAEVDEMVRQQTDPQHSYERVAAEIHRQVVAGELAEGALLPPEKKLVADHGVSVSTVRRAVALLREWGTLGAVGRRVALQTLPPATPIDLTTAAQGAGMGARYWSVTLRGPDGHRYPQRLVQADLTDPRSFRPHLLGIARMEVPDGVGSWTAWAGQCELEIRAPDTDVEQAPAVSLRLSG